VIPAAGLGRRFLPASRVVPKELLPMGGKPLIHHALDEVERAGFERAVVVLAPGKDLIKTYFELGDALAIAQRLQLRFVEQPNPNGVGEAVLLGAASLHADTCAVLLPDDVVTANGHWAALLAAHRQTDAACLCIRPVKPADSGRFGMVACEIVSNRLRITGLAEKPAPANSPSNLAIFGRYIVTAPVLNALETLYQTDRHSEISLTEGFAAVLHLHPGAYAVPFYPEIFDAGTPAAYADALMRYERSTQASKQVQHAV
jgi:UTP-glucose-1-phosphate uridylyltransferase